MLDRLRQSLALRLAVQYALVFALGTAALFGLLYWVLGEALQASEQAYVERRAEILATVYELRGVPGVESMSNDPSADVRTFFVRLVTSEGRLVFSRLPPDWIETQVQSVPLPLPFVGEVRREIRSERIPANALRDYAVATRQHRLTALLPRRTQDGRARGQRRRVRPYVVEPPRPCIGLPARGERLQCQHVDHVAGRVGGVVAERHGRLRLGSPERRETRHVVNDQVGPVPASTQLSPSPSTQTRYTGSQEITHLLRLKEKRRFLITRAHTLKELCDHSHDSFLVTIDIERSKPGSNGPMVTARIPHGEDARRFVEAFSVEHRFMQNPIKLL